MKTLFLLIIPLLLLFSLPELAKSSQDYSGSVETAVQVDYESMDQAEILLMTLQTDQHSYSTIHAQSVFDGHYIGNPVGEKVTLHTDKHHNDESFFNLVAAHESLYESLLVDQSKPTSIGFRAKGLSTPHLYI